MRQQGASEPGLQTSSLGLVRTLSNGGVVPLVVPGTGKQFLTVRKIVEVPAEKKPCAELLMIPPLIIRSRAFDFPSKWSDWRCLRIQIRNSWNSAVRVPTCRNQHVPAAKCLISTSVPVMVVALFSSSSSSRNSPLITVQRRLLMLKSTLKRRVSTTSHSGFPRTSEDAAGDAIVTLQTGCHLDTICSFPGVSVLSDPHKRPRETGRNNKQHSASFYS